MTSYTGSRIPSDRASPAAGVLWAPTEPLEKSRSTSSSTVTSLETSSSLSLSNTASPALFPSAKHFNPTSLATIGRRGSQLLWCCCCNSNNLGEKSNFERESEIPAKIRRNWGELIGSCRRFGEYCEESGVEGVIVVVRRIHANVRFFQAISVYLSVYPGRKSNCSCVCIDWCDVERERKRRWSWWLRMDCNLWWWRSFIIQNNSAGSDFEIVDDILIILWRQEKKKKVKKRYNYWVHS